MIHKSWFIWKDINSLDLGIIINKLPSIIKAEKNISKIDVIGRNGFLTQDYNTYKPCVKSVECTIKNLENIDAICTWLDGNDNVIFSNEENRIYKATIINQIPIDKIARTYHRFIIQFECQPFKYSRNDNPIIKITETKEITNPGTVESTPVITIYGYGSIDLNINDNIINLTNVADHIIIDSEIMDCYRDGQLMNNYMKGNFPMFKVGTNKISWMGNVQRIEIKPNWRWL